MTIDYFNNSFGVSVFLPNCAFDVEISRHVISQTIMEIDESLTEQHIEDDVDERIAVAVDTILRSAHLLSTGQCSDHNKAVTDIAFCFLYSFQKVHGMTRVIELRGLIGMMEENKLIFSPCVTDAQFKSATSSIREQIEQDENLRMYDPVKPVLH